MKDLKDIQQMVISYGMHSPCVREMAKIWASTNGVAPHDWLQLVSVVLEDGMQLQWKCYLREEAKALEYQGRVKGFEATQGQILGEGHYADPQSQAIYNEHILSLCHTTALNAWNRIPEPRKRIE